ncbi:MAG: glycoside hydrolase family 36 protein [Victivallales bacterium]
MMIQSTVGEICVKGDFGTAWTLSHTQTVLEPGLEVIRLHLETPDELPPPGFTLSWSVPQLDMQTRWHPKSIFNRYIPADWGGSTESDLATSAPLMAFLNLKGQNRLTFAVSEAKRFVKFSGGVCEESNRIGCKIELFTVPEAPLHSYDVELRLDTRSIFYADAIRSVAEWFASFPEYKPAVAPEAAFEPIYSSWYSYHQQLFDHELEAECARAGEYGMKGIIVDDGWQTDDNNRGYAFCGDWEISKKRFPDMRAHVAKIHALGMKYVVWYSVPFVGFKSRAYDRFKGKFLYENQRLNTAVVDPRFPEIREYLINIYETAIREWDLDGFKLDFIDSFCYYVYGFKDPAVAENYAGRDIKSLPEACDVLLSEIMRRLRSLKPDILIEFRQSYIGPAIRKYGNMLRAADCPADILSNRLRTLDLRLTSGNTAVHSDMLEWNENETAELAALQLLNVLFSVPQISVRLDRIPESHRRMLHFWLDFCIRHREVLLHGYLKPYHPEMNYPIVSSETAREKVIAVYNYGQVVKVACDPGKPCYVINATGRSELVLELQNVPVSAELFDTFGRPVSVPVLKAGPARVSIPYSGLLVLNF